MPALASSVVQRAPSRFYSTRKFVRLLLPLSDFVLAGVFAIGRHHSYPFAALWAAIGVVNLWVYSGIWWELRSDGLFERRGIQTQVIAYQDVVSVDADANPKGPVIVHFAGLTPGGFPLATMKIQTHDRAALIFALRELASAAEFRT